MSLLNFDLNPLFFFPPGVNDLMFQHFTGNQLLVASEVCSSFYDFIAESKQCMEKIKLKVAKQTMNEDEQQSLTESGRRYVNIEVSSFIGKAIEVVAALGRKWKSVTLRCVDFETVADFVEFLSLFEATVEELYMDQVYIKSVFRRVTAPYLVFEKLRVLEAKCCQALLFHEAFINCMSLESFSIKSGSEISSSALNAIKKILQSNVGLKKLGIHFNVFNLIFSEDVASNVHFNLTNYHASNLYRVPSYQATSQSHLNSFLESQIQTIEILSISDWMGVSALKTIFSMPRLTDVTIKGFHHAGGLFTDWENLQLNTNTSIVKMNFNDMSSNFQILEKVVKATPNLKFLSLYLMDQKAMKFVAHNCKSLEFLHVDRFQAHDISDSNMFASLKEFSVKRKSEKLSVQSETKQLSRFQNLVYLK